MKGYYLDSVRMACVIMLVTLGMHLGNASISSSGVQQLQGVVNSSMTIRCYVPVDFDTETVRWFVNSSTIPFLTYVPKDNIISPTNHDPRFSITEPEELDLSRLMKSDSGLYECRLTSAKPGDDVISTINITVKDGCTMTSYNQPLVSTNQGCSPGDVLTYGQQCHFTCPEGFSLVGNDSTQCLGNGELSSQTPTCEEIICQIGYLPYHLKDTNGTCTNDVQVRYGVTCHFQCATGYRLTGNGTVQITCDREQEEHFQDFPECEEESKESSRLPGGYVALICLLLIVSTAATALGVLLWILRGPRKGKRYNAEKTVQEMTPLVITTFDGFIDFLRQQIGENYAASTIGTILHKLEKVELINIPKLERMKFPDGEAKSMRSITDAFVWYVAEIIRCIGKSNPAAVVDLMNDIISFTEEIASAGSKTTASIVSVPQENDDGGTKDYFEVVHCAVENLLLVMQNDIKDLHGQETVNQRTTRVSAMMKSYFKNNKPEIKDTAIASFETIKPSWVNSSDGARFFAKMCLQNIGRCANVNDRIQLRCNILRIMFDLAGARDDVIKEKLEPPPQP